MERIFGFLALLFAGTALCAGTNLVTDPGMEESSPAWRSWGGKPGKKVELVFDADRPHSGRYSLRVTDRWTECRPYATQFAALPPRTDPAQVLTLTWYARGKAGARFRAGLLFNESPKVCLGIRWNHFTLSGQWQKYTMTFPNVPAQTTLVNLFLGPTEDVDTATGTVWFDDMCLEWRTTPPAEKLGIDTPVANQQNYPRTPADGIAVNVNPPAFVLRPPLDWKPGKYTYTLEYAQNPEFRNARRVTGLAIHVHVPREVLAPGVWYWRFGVENQPGGTVWSRVWRFTVPENAPRDPFPGAAALDNVPKGHPRLIATPDTLADFRKRAKSGDLKPIADWLLDGSHKFMCGKKLLGQKLADEPDFLPDRHKDFQAYLRAFCKVMNDTRPTQYLMERAALTYLLTGDPAIGAEAKRRVLHFFGWDPEGSTSLFHNDEPAMWIMRWGLASYDWTHELYTPEERKKIERAIYVRAEQFYKFLREMPFDSRPYSSHPNGYLKILGEAAIVLAHEYPEAAKRWFEYSAECYRAIYPTYGTPDGGWNEGVAYWSYTNAMDFDWLVKIRNATGLDLGNKPYFRNCGYYALYGWPYETRLPSFGDGGCPRGNVMLTQTIAAAYVGNSDWMSSFWQSGGIPSPEVVPDKALIHRDLRAMGKPDLGKLPPARFFPDLGFAVMRNRMGDYPNDVGLIFECTPYGNSSHRHNAQNCFMLEAYTEPLLISSGYYDAYGSLHHRHWTWETRSHCSITYDGGKGQIRGGEAAGRLTDWRHDADFDTATGDATRAYPGAKRVTRTIVHVRPGYFVIFDRAEAEKPRVWEFNLHTVRPGRFDAAKQTMTAEMPKAGVLVKFFAPSPLVFSDADREPHRPNRNVDEWPERWHFRAALAKPDRTLDLVTVLLPYRTGAAAKLPQVEKLADGVLFRFADGHSATVRMVNGKVVTEKR